MKMVILMMRMIAARNRRVKVEMLVMMMEVTERCESRSSYIELAHH